MPSNEFEALSVEFDGKLPWQRCPSAHCERAQECRSPHECSGTGIPAAIRQAKTEGERQAAYRKRRADKISRYEAALAEIAKRGLYRDWSAKIAMAALNPAIPPTDTPHSAETGVGGMNPARDGLIALGGA